MKSLELIAMTDHGPAMPGSANIYYFHNLRVIPNYLYDVEILKGMEANIIGTDGSLDISDLDAEMMDVLIASFHMPCLRPELSGEYKGLFGGHEKQICKRYRAPGRQQDTR